MENIENVPKIVREESWGVCMCLHLKENFLKIEEKLKILKCIKLKIENVEEILFYVDTNEWKAIYSDLNLQHLSIVCASTRK